MDPWIAYVAWAVMLGMLLGGLVMVVRVVRQERSKKGPHILDSRSVREVIKFIPEGRDDVPASAFRSVRGKSAFEEFPGRFSRGRSERIVGVYEGIAQDYKSMLR